jgi:hypothetical protein
MNAAELESEHIEQIRRVGCLLLLPADDAIQLIRSCASSEDVRLLGVEAYRILDDAQVQPGIEFSNISFGQMENDGRRFKLKTFERGLRTPWENQTNLHDATVRLIDEGKANGYAWYEVSIEDLATREMLFFRKFPEENAG